MSTLKNFRAEIDRIDEEIIALLAQRFAASEAIAEEKRQENKSVFDGERERIILEKVRNLAREKGLSPAIAERIFNFLFHESRRAQEARLQLNS